MSERRLGNRIVTLSLLLVALGLIAAWFFARHYLSDAHQRARIDLVESFTGGPNNPEWPYLDAVDLTDEVCGAEVDCVQAVGNEYLSLYKFRSVEEAVHFVTPLGEAGFQADPIVLHFNGTELSEEERRGIAYTVYNYNTSSEGFEYPQAR